MEQQVTDLASNLEQTDEGTEQPVTEKVLSLKRLGQSIRQIAEAIGLPPTTVHRLIHTHEEQHAPDPVPPPPESLLARLEQERQRATEATAIAQHASRDAQEQLWEAETALRAAEEALQASPVSHALERAGQVREAKASVEDARAVVAVLHARWQAVSEAENKANHAIEDVKGRVVRLREQTKYQRQAVAQRRQAVVEVEHTLTAARDSLAEAERILAGVAREIAALQGEEPTPAEAA